MSSEGITVMVTTHFLEEAEYCNDIILINAGKIIATGSPKELKQNYIKHPILEVQCSNVVEAMEKISDEPWALETSVFGTYLHVNVEDEALGIERIKQVLSDRKIDLLGIERITPSLEDVFIFLLEREGGKN
jgi:ABC-2 type transport system ATP-binding protein